MSAVEKVVILKQGRLFVSWFRNTNSLQLLLLLHIRFFLVLLGGAGWNIVNFDILTGQSPCKVLHLSPLQIAKLLICRVMISASTQGSLNYIWIASCRIACRF